MSLTESEDMVFVLDGNVALEYWSVLAERLLQME